MRALFLLLVVIAALAGASYAGARLTSGKLVGPGPNNLGPLAPRFAFEGIETLPDKPRGWIMAYPQAAGFGREGAEIYVSVTGNLLGTWPEDLAERIDAQRPAEP